MSTRRTLICAIAGALLAAGFAGRAQTPGKVYRIGWLSGGPWAGTQPLEAFNQGMRELGWVEGRHYRKQHERVPRIDHRVKSGAREVRCTQGLLPSEINSSENDFSEIAWTAFTPSS